MTESFQSGNQFVLLSLNPKSGRRSSAERASILSRNLEARGFTVETHMELDEVTSRANQLRAQGLLHALVGVGGDGTAAYIKAYHPANKRTAAACASRLLTDANILRRIRALHDAAAAPKVVSSVARIAEHCTIRPNEARLYRDGAKGFVDADAAATLFHPERRAGQVVRYDRVVDPTPVALSKRNAATIFGIISSYRVVGDTAPRDRTVQDKRTTSKLVVGPSDFTARYRKALAS